MKISRFSSRLQCSDVTVPFRSVPKRFQNKCERRYKAKQIETVSHPIIIRTGLLRFLAPKRSETNMNTLDP